MVTEVTAAQALVTQSVMAVPAVMEVWEGLLATVGLVAMVVLELRQEHQSSSVVGPVA